MVAGILFLTTQKISDNAAISERFRKLLIECYESAGIDSASAWWNDRLAVRRLGHVIESHRVNSILKAIGLCLLISVLDQTVKIFVPVRHFDIVDIGFDLIGAVAGVLIVTAVGMMIEGIKRS